MTRVFWDATWMIPGEKAKSDSPEAAHHTHINFLTAGAAYIRVFHFLLAHYVSPFEHVKDKM